MATIVAARREPDGAIVLIVREEREIRIPAEMAAGKGKALREVARTAVLAAVRSEAGRVLAEAAEEAEAAQKGGRG